MSRKKNTWPVTPAGKFFQVMLPTGVNRAPEAHYVDEHISTCSCHRGSRCPALHEVRAYLAAGGTREVEQTEKSNSNDLLPISCPICGAPVQRDNFGTRRGWRCTAGGLAHYYQAHYQHLQAWLTRPANERLITLATPAERAATALTYPAGA